MLRFNFTFKTQNCVEKILLDLTSVDRKRIKLTNFQNKMKGHARRIDRGQPLHRKAGI